MTLHFISKTPFNSSFFQPIRNRLSSDDRGTIKPLGGLWTSPMGSSCSWEQICRDGYINISDAKTYSLCLVPETKIITVTSSADLKRLPFRSDAPNTIDWELLAQHYDAFWLTTEGMLDTILSNPHLCGWDCETVLVMNPHCIQQ